MTSDWLIMLICIGFGFKNDTLKYSKSILELGSSPGRRSITQNRLKVTHGIYKMQIFVIASFQHVTGRLLFIRFYYLAFPGEPLIS